MNTVDFGLPTSTVTILLFLALSLPTVCKTREFGPLLTVPPFTALVRATPPILVRATPEALKSQVYSILKDVPGDGMSLVDRIVFLDEWTCNGDCYQRFPTKYSPRRYPRCQTCHCDTMCHFYRDCCPGVILKHNVTYPEVPRVTECITKTAVVYNPSNLQYNDYQAVVPQCPSTQVGARGLSREDIEKCDHPDIEDQEQFQPVSSPLSGLTYRNIFCARCHNDSRDLDPWSASVSCAGSAKALISTTHTKEELYRKLVNQTSVKHTTCELRYNIPNPSKDLDAARTLGGTYKRFCNKVYPPLIDTCNASGESGFRDPELERACAMYESVFDGKYRNMFCYLCNQPFPLHRNQFQMSVAVPAKANPGRLDFTALLDFGNDEAWTTETKEETVKDVQCNVTQYYDILTCECRDLECSEGKFLDKDGTCQSLIATDMLGYRICRRLDISTTTPISEPDVSRLRFYFGQIVPKFAKYHTCHVLKYCPDAMNVSFHFEDLFSTVGTLEDLEERINATHEKYLSVVNETLESVINSRIVLEYPCVDVVRTERQCPSDSGFSIAKSSMEAPLQFGERTDVYYIGYTETSRCAYVSLSVANFSFNEENETLTFIPTGDQVPASGLSILHSPDENEGGTVRMCVSDYEDMINPTSYCRDKSTDDLDFDTWTISGLISIVSTVISLICLALTFTVYLILAPLRIGGGKNIMVLTVLLFIAQALYEFGMEQFENRGACRAIGVLIHYTWLAAVFAMNACTIERFLKLCFPLKSRSFFLSERKPFMFATSYALLCPLVIVSSNMAANMAAVGDIGYGNPRICYINTRTSRVFAFAVPMGVVLLANVVLLGFTLWTLRKHSDATGDSGVSGGVSHGVTGGASHGGAQTTSAQSTKNNKIGLLGCVRLSVVTGTMWLLIFLYEAIPSQILTYIITALVGLQGLVFFLSMIVNKRVIRMLKKKAAELSSGSGTTSSGTDSSHLKHHARHQTNSQAASKQQLLSNSRTTNTVSQELSTSKDNTQLSSNEKINVSKT